MVGRMLTTLDVDGYSVAKLLLVQRFFREAPEGNTLMFGDIRISYLFDKYSPASGVLSHRPEALDPVEA